MPRFRIPGPLRRLSYARLAWELVLAVERELARATDMASAVAAYRERSLHRPGDPLAVAAASGRLHRNFQGYTDDDRKVLLGLGASSISTFARASTSPPI